MSVTRGVANGKVILLGEHAVVYGVPAIALGIDRGVRAIGRSVDEQAAAVGVGSAQSSLIVRAWNLRTTESDKDVGGTPEASIARAFSALLASTRAAQLSAGREPVRALEIEIEVEVPPGGGLGCSAALGVAIARTLDPDATASEIVGRVAAWEGVFHGNASGVDAAVAASGGCLYFTRSEGMTAVPLRAPLHLAIGNTGVASSTKAMVDGIARLKERRPDVVEKSFEGIRALVANARLAVEGGDIVGLGKLMDLNQMLLSGLFVSSDEIERLCSVARAEGALGAKLTGAGGGGSVVALASDGASASRIKDAWSAIGFSAFATTVGARRHESIAIEAAE